MISASFCHLCGDTTLYRTTLDIHTAFLLKENVSATAYGLQGTTEMPITIVTRTNTKS